MRTQSTTWGLILIGAGLVFLLGTQGYLTVDWDAIWRLWPALLDLRRVGPDPGVSGGLG